MVSAALVSTLAVASLRQVWQGGALESAQRQRQEAFWMLRGGLDWSRFLLRQDAQVQPEIDHPSEPWAQGGLIEDLQGRINLLDSVYESQTHNRQSREESRAQVRRLFDVLGLSGAQAQLLLDGLEKASNARLMQRPLLPQRLEDLAWLGISSGVIEALAPYVCFLPEPVPLNLNTASEVAIRAAIDGVSSQSAQALIRARERHPLNSLEEAAGLLDLDQPLPPQRFALSSNYFMARGQAHSLEIQAQLQRVGTQVQVLGIMFGQ